MEAVSVLDAQQQDSCHSGIAKLPTELLYHVIRLAASTDHKTALACAFVSKLVCRWTAPDRWRTIICTSTRQIQALWQLLEFSTRRHPYHGFTSLPGRQPGAFVENLFIDTSASEHELKDLVSELFEKDSRLEPACSNLGAHNGLTYSAQHHPHGVNDILRHFQHVNYLALGPQESWLRLDAVSPVKVLFAREGESDLIHSIDQMGPHLSNDPQDPPHVDDALWRADGSGIWRPSLETFRRRLTCVHFVAVDPQSKLSGVRMPVREIEALRAGSFAHPSLVRRVADHEAGGSPPRLSHRDQQEAAESRWYIWPAEDPKGERRYIRGSDSLHSRSAVLRPEGSVPSQINDSSLDLHPFDNPYSRITPAFWNDFQQGVTNVRYDTRKFAFRPCEITASKLRPFMEELTTTGVAPPATDDGASTSTTASFTHSGPRHAAPHRGAGHFSKPVRGEQHDKAALTPKQAALKTFGCNKFQTLHLCWDPMPDTNDSTDGVRNGAGVNGETDWPVERQDIWTNTSSQNNKAQALPPHTVQARAAASSSAANKVNLLERSDNPRRSWIIPSSIESKQSKAFRADMIDSIRTTIGWTRQDQLLLSDTPWLSRGSNLAQRLDGEDRLHRLESLVSEIAYQQISSEAGTSSGFVSCSNGVGSGEKLKIRMVPPAERLRLGGMYVPYTKAQRVQWFLDNLDSDDA
ncbi:hypothetical protein EX895_000377 [Sporisorium graminicola]|uniref:Uncharacterized protein n=1 Tax=Sporisorium graminicola TaxID=280036 RepID=A0A4V6EUM6_9BASI|nr:hypothetical protein EX895_000377 [Sporisorium graminicola]TKY90379.1 hypothetical protein EX895_000377 [Sporisorium graminicola]